MRITVLLAVLALGITDLSFAWGDTAWVRLYRGPIYDYGQAIAVNHAGEFCVTGKSVREGSDEDFVTIIYDSLGVQRLLDFYTGPGVWYDQATAATCDAAGNFYVVGHSMTDSAAPRDYDILRIKYPVSGPREVASVGCGGDTNELTHSAVADSAGNVYVAGSVGVGSGISRCLVMKLDTSGIARWTAAFGGAGTEDDEYRGAGVDRSGNVLVAGRCWRASEDLVAAKYAPDSTLLWMKFVDGGMADAAEAAVVDDSGCLYAAGYSELSGTEYDFLIVKFDPQGDTVWTRRYNAPDSGSEWACAMTIDSSGSVYVTGVSDGAGSGDDFLTVKYRRDGSLAWAARYSGPYYHDVPYDIGADRRGGAYVVGRTAITSSNDDCIIVAYDSLGSVAWSRTYAGSSGQDDMFYRVAVGPSGDPCAVGWVWNESTGTDVVAAKYRGASGVVERQVNPGRSAAPASIVTGVLNLPGLGTRSGLSDNPVMSRAALLDAIGRSVMTLKPGPNDVSRLAPGVYFVREEGSRVQGARGSSVRKVVVAR